jgi:hypothetical protein
VAVDVMGPVFLVGAGCFGSVCSKAALLLDVDGLRLRDGVFPRKNHASRMVPSTAMAVDTMASEGTSGSTTKDDDGRDQQREHGGAGLLHGHDGLHQHGAQNGGQHVKPGDEQYGRRDDADQPAAQEPDEDGQ